MGMRQGLHGVCKKQLRGETDWRKGLRRTSEWSHETDGPGVLSVRFRPSVKQETTRASLSTETKATDLDPNRNAL